MPEFKSVADYLKFKEDGPVLLQVEEKDDDSVFEYEIPVSETVATISVDKDYIINRIENRIGRTLTKSESAETWHNIKHTTDWYRVFPSYGGQCGVHVYGESDEQWYEDCFKPDVEKAIQDAVEEVFSEMRHGLFDAAIDDICDELKKETKETPEKAEMTPEEITWENVAQQSQKRIQDENVKNGLARCANEKKSKSIEKWKEHYVKTHITVSDSMLTKGKTKDDIIKNIISYLS